MLKIVIVDDEQGGRNVLEGMVKRFCPNAVVAATADSVDSGLAAIREHRPGLVFRQRALPRRPSTPCITAIRVPITLSEQGPTCAAGRLLMFDAAAGTQ